MMKCIALVVLLVACNGNSMCAAGHYETKSSIEYDALLDVPKIVTGDVWVCSATVVRIPESWRKKHDKGSK